MLVEFACIKDLTQHIHILHPTPNTPYIHTTILVLPA